MDNLSEKAIFDLIETNSLIVPPPIPARDVQQVCLTIAFIIVIVIVIGIIIGIIIDFGIVIKTIIITAWDAHNFHLLHCHNFCHPAIGCLAGKIVYDEEDDDPDH